MCFAYFGTNALLATDNFTEYKHCVCACWECFCFSSFYFVVDGPLPPPPPKRPNGLVCFLQVVMKRDSPPFVFVEGDGASESDFTGITPEFLKARSWGDFWGRGSWNEIIAPANTGRESGDKGCDGIVHFSF